MSGRISARAGGLLGDATGVLLFRVGGAGVRFLAQVLIANWLGVEDYGRFAVAVGSAEIIAQLSTAGYPQALLRHVPGEGDADGARLGAMVRIATRHVLVWGLAIGGAHAGVAAVTGYIDDAGPWLALVALLPPAAALALVLEAGLAATGRVRAGAAISESIRPLGLVGVGLLGLVSARGEFPVAVGAVVGLAAATAVVQWVVLDPPPSDRSLGAIAGEWTRTARFSWVSSIALTLMYQVDIVIVGVFLGASEAGVYAAVSRLAAVARLPLRAIESAVLPRLSASLHDRDQGRSIELLAVASFSGGLIGLGVLVVVGIGGGVLLGIFGDGFSAAHGALVALLLGNLVNAATGTFPDVVWLLGRVRLHALVLLAHAVVLLVSMPWVAERYGVTGVAWLSTATMCSWNLVLSVLAGRMLRSARLSA